MVRSINDKGSKAIKELIDGGEHQLEESNLLNRAVKKSYCSVRVLWLGTKVTKYWFCSEWGGGGGGGGRCIISLPPSVSIPEFMGGSRCCLGGKVTPAALLP